jgi:SAM-dependent methyltransferase
MQPMADWISFFDKDHPIYVNDVHRRTHARLIARGILHYVQSPDAVVLDYGCGEALHAGAVAEHCGKLILCEAAPTLRADLAARYENDRIVSVVSPEQAALLPNASVDLIVLHSVAQYLTREELDAFLALFHRLLRPGGLLVLGDIVRPEVWAMTDAGALLGLGAANGFFLAALGGLARTLVSDYWRLRKQRGLTRYSETAIRKMLNARGFAAERATYNIGHNQARMTFVARHKPPEAAA